MFAIFLGLLGLLIFVKPVFAGEPPTQITPAPNSTVSSSALNWQVPAYPVCSSYDAYRIQVDDDPSFLSSSIYRNIYTKNTYYTPQLYSGTWYWRVMARDETCNNWSTWSNVWSFTLATASPSPTPASTQAPTPSPISTSSSSPQSSSLFTISNIPSQINSDQSFSVTVNLSLPNNPNTNFYLKGAFKKLDSSNYFGQTKVSGNWVKNGGGFLNQYQITTNNSGDWSSNLEIKPDSEDSGFTGSDDYIFKIGRYTSSGSGPTWSNEATIKIISIESDQGGTLTNNSSPATIPSDSPSFQPKSYNRLVYNSASVAAATTSAKSTPLSAAVSIKDQRKINPLFWIGLIFIFAGAGLIGYIYLKKNGKIPI